MVRVASEARQENAAPRLLALLLIDALRTIARDPRARRARLTREWLCAGDAPDPNSFEAACGAVGVPPAELRRRLGLRATAPRRRSARGWMRGPGY
jgi:hypothetical protein